MGPNNVVEPSSAASPWGDESWVAHAVLGWAENRAVSASDPKNTARPASELTLEIGETITPQGIGGQRAMSIFSNILAKATRAQDDPLNLAYIPAAPTRAAVAFDAATSAANIFAGTWEAGAGAIWAENQALAWLIRLLQWPSTAEGVFVSGGTTGNLSAMHAARETARRRRVEAGLPPRPATGWRMACAETAHSSIFSAARVLDVELVPLPVNEERRLTGAALTAALDELEEPESLFAVVASAGSTNAGIVDDLASLADVTTEQGIWLHVDGAYGGAGLCAPTIRPLYRGIERAQSMIVDPHKWLFAPYDCCALVYRNGADARAAHAQHASYLDSIDREEPNPTDLAIHLSRRARGLPLWFSLATHGTDAYTAAVERTVAIAREVARGIRDLWHLKLLRDPDLTVLLFTREGWSPERYHEWSRNMSHEGEILCVPTVYEGETVLRLAFVNPATDPQQVLRRLTAEAMPEVAPY